LQGTRHAAGQGAVDVEAARHAQRGHAFDLEVVLQLHGALGLRGHTKGLVGLLELGFVNALLFSPGQHGGVGVEHLLFAMDGGEHADVHLLDQVHGFEGVVQALLGHEVVPESHRHAAHHHVFGGFLGPLLERGLKHIAVGAAVPEELQHLDLAVARFGGHGAVQGDVVLARAEGLLRPS